MSHLRGQILVVDDSRLSRSRLQYALEQQGHQVAPAGGGRPALELLAGRPFDLVLLDMLMPEMSGMELLQRLKDHPDLRRLPVLVISALEDMDSVVRCIEMGAEDYLIKPFDPVLLRARTTACIEKKRLRDAEQAYLDQVARVTAAAAAVESGSFDVSSLDEVAGRDDDLGRMARVFQQMARNVQAREQQLRRQVSSLQIEIDRNRTQRQVAEIKESDYFRDLQQQARQLRAEMENENG
jgi:PleD family two-component response regulator